MIFSVQGRDFGSSMTSIQLKLVRTYKGEIQRTQTGLVAAFPNSFVTVGFDLSFVGARSEMSDLQQIMLSADTVEIVTDYNGTTIKGKFSCTTNDYAEVRDKSESMIRLSLSVVSDGTSITNAAGGVFKVTVGSATGTQLATGYFGRVVTVGASYKKNGAKLPGGSLLILGDEVVTL